MADQQGGDQVQEIVVGFLFGVSFILLTDAGYCLWKGYRK